VRVHVLAPVPRAGRAFTVTSRPLGEGLAITVHSGVGSDLVLCTPGGPRRFETERCEFVGELLHARTDAAGALRSFLAVQARRLSWNAAVVMAAQGVTDWVATGEDPDTRLVAPAVRNGHVCVGATPASSERA
jgi:hypothetical protein